MAFCIVACNFCFSFADLCAAFSSIISPQTERGKEIKLWPGRSVGRSALCAIIVCSGSLCSRIVILLFFFLFLFFFSLGGALISVLGNVFFLAAEWRLVNLRAAFRLRKLQ